MTRPFQFSLFALGAQRHGMALGYILGGACVAISAGRLRRSRSGSRRRRSALDLADRSTANVQGSARRASRGAGELPLRQGRRLHRGAALRGRRRRISGAMETRPDVRRGRRRGPRRPQGVRLFLEDRRAFRGRRSGPERAFDGVERLRLGRATICATGIASAKLAPDPERAFDLFRYAATYFGDADAQYNVARMYLDGVGVKKDMRQGMNWLDLAARKGHAPAQALLGEMMFNGEAGGAAQRPRGLMYLTLAREPAERRPPISGSSIYTPRRWLRPARRIAGPPSRCWKTICARRFRHGRAQKAEFRARP